MESEVGGRAGRQPEGAGRQQAKFTSPPPGPVFWYFCKNAEIFAFVFPLENTMENTVSKFTRENTLSKITLGKITRENTKGNLLREITKGKYKGKFI